jgi:hypothetical protein
MARSRVPRFSETHRDRELIAVVCISFARWWAQRRNSILRCSTYGGKYG